ncbi:MAG: response regulator, partial [Candidatus Omnitrophota bacterium]
SARVQAVADYLEYGEPLPAGNASSPVDVGAAVTTVGSVRPVSSLVEGEALEEDEASQGRNMSRGDFLLDCFQVAAVVFTIMNMRNSFKRNNEQLRVQPKAKFNYDPSIYDDFWHAYQEDEKAAFNFKQRQALPAALKDELFGGNRTGNDFSLNRLYRAVVFALLSKVNPLFTLAQCIQEGANKRNDFGINFAFNNPQSGVVNNDFWREIVQPRFRDIYGVEIGYDSSNWVRMLFDPWMGPYIYRRVLEKKLCSYPERLRMTKAGRQFKSISECQTLDEAARAIQLYQGWGGIKAGKRWISYTREDSKHRCAYGYSILAMMLLLQQSPNKAVVDGLIRRAVENLRDFVIEFDSGFIDNLGVDVRKLASSPVDVGAVVAAKLEQKAVSSPVGVAIEETEAIPSFNLYSWYRKGVLTHASYAKALENRGLDSQRLEQALDAVTERYVRGLLKHNDLKEIGSGIQFVVYSNNALNLVVKIPRECPEQEDNVVRYIDEYPRIGRYGAGYMVLRGLDLIINGRRVKEDVAVVQVLVDVIGDVQVGHIQSGNKAGYETVDELVVDKHLELWRMGIVDYSFKFWFNWGLVSDRDSRIKAVCFDIADLLNMEHDRAVIQTIMMDGDIFNRRLKLGLSTVSNFLLARTDRQLTPPEQLLPPIAILNVIAHLTEYAKQQLTHERFMDLLPRTKEGFNIARRQWRDAVFVEQGVEQDQIKIIEDTLDHASSPAVNHQIDIDKLVARINDLLPCYFTGARCQEYAVVLKWALELMGEDSALMGILDKRQTLVHIFVESVHYGKIDIYSRGYNGTIEGVDVQDLGLYDIDLYTLGITVVQALASDVLAILQQEIDRGDYLAGLGGQGSSPVQVQDKFGAVVGGKLEQKAVSSPVYDEEWMLAAREEAQQGGKTRSLPKDSQGYIGVQQALVDAINVFGPALDRRLTEGNDLPSLMRLRYMDMIAQRGIDAVEVMGVEKDKPDFNATILFTHEYLLPVVVFTARAWGRAQVLLRQALFARGRQGVHSDGNAQLKADVAFALVRYCFGNNEDSVEKANEFIAQMTEARGRPVSTEREPQGPSDFGCNPAGWEIKILIFLSQILRAIDTNDFSAINIESYYTAGLQKEIERIYRDREIILSDADRVNDPEVLGLSRQIQQARPFIAQVVIGIISNLACYACLEGKFSEAEYREMARTFIAADNLIGRYIRKHDKGDLTGYQEYVMDMLDSVVFKNISKGLRYILSTATLLVLPVEQLGKIKKMYSQERRGSLPVTNDKLRVVGEPANTPSPILLISNMASIPVKESRNILVHFSYLKTILLDIGIISIAVSLNTISLAFFCGGIFLLLICTTILYSKVIEELPQEELLNYSIRAKIRRGVEDKIASEMVVAKNKRFRQAKYLFLQVLNFYFEPKPFEYGGRIYERIGIKFFNKALNIATSHIYLLALLGYRSLYTFERYFTRFAEIIHLFLLISLSLSICDSSSEFFVWDCVFLVLQFYLVILQRYNRARIYMILKRHNNSGTSGSFGAGVNNLKQDTSIVPLSEMSSSPAGNLENRIVSNPGRAFNPAIVIRAGPGTSGFSSSPVGAVVGGNSKQWKASSPVEVSKVLRVKSGMTRRNFIIGSAAISAAAIGLLLTPRPSLGSYKGLRTFGSNDCLDSEILRLLHLLPSATYYNLRSINFLDDGMFQRRTGYEPKDAAACYCPRSIIVRKTALPSDHELYPPMIIHELGHHNYTEYVTVQKCYQLVRYYLTNPDDFETFISRYAAYGPFPKEKLTDKVKATQRSWEAFAETFLAWVYYPNLLFFNEKIDNSLSVKFFIEQVARCFIFENEGRIYIRFYIPKSIKEYLPGSSQKDYMDIRINNKDITFDELVSLYITNLPALIKNRETHLSQLTQSIGEDKIFAYRFFTFLCGTEFLRRKAQEDHLIDTAAPSNPVVPLSSIREPLRGIMCDLEIKRRKEIRHGNGEVLVENRSVLTSLFFSNEFSFDLLPEDIKKEWLRISGLDKLKADWEFRLDVNSLLMGWGALSDESFIKAQPRLKFISGLFIRANVPELIPALQKSVVVGKASVSSPASETITLTPDDIEALGELIKFLETKAKQVETAIENSEWDNVMEYSQEVTKHLLMQQNQGGVIGAIAHTISVGPVVGIEDYDLARVDLNNGVFGQLYSDADLLGYNPGDQRPKDKEALLQDWERGVGILKNVSDLLHAIQKASKVIVIKIEFGELVDVADILRNTSSPVTGRAYRILLVDDSEYNRKTFLKRLEMGCSKKLMVTFEVIVALDGQEALGILTANQGKFDILITDLTMPELNGHDLAKATRSQWPRIYMIKMSGRDQPDTDEEERIKDDSDVFFLKTDNLARFIEVVSAAIEEVDQARLDASSPVSAVVGSKLSVWSKFLRNMKLISIFYFEPLIENISGTLKNLLHPVKAGIAVLALVILFPFYAQAYLVSKSMYYDYVADIYRNAITQQFNEALSDGNFDNGEFVDIFTGIGGKMKEADFAAREARFSFLDFFARMNNLQRPTLEQITMNEDSGVSQERIKEEQSEEDAPAATSETEAAPVASNAPKAPVPAESKDRVTVTPDGSKKVEAPQDTKAIVNKPAQPVTATGPPQQAPAIDATALKQAQ